MKEEAIDRFLIGLLSVVIIGIVVMITFIIYQSVNSYFHPPEFVKLQLDSWHCTRSFEEKYFNGKVWSRRTACAEYERGGINE